MIFIKNNFLSKTQHPNGICFKFGKVTMITHFLIYKLKLQDNTSIELVTNFKSTIFHNTCSIQVHLPVKDIYLYEVHNELHTIALCTKYNYPIQTHQHGLSSCFLESNICNTYSRTLYHLDFQVPVFFWTVYIKTSN